MEKVSHPALSERVWLMILNTGRSDLRTLVNLLEMKCRRDDTDFTLFRFADGYKILPGIPDLGVESKLRLIELTHHESIEEALSHYLLFKEPDDVQEI